MASDNPFMDLPNAPEGVADNPFMTLPDAKPENSAAKYYALGIGKTPGEERLPGWIQKIHDYIDPMQSLGGLPGVASMALPAGRGTVKAPTEAQLSQAGAADYDFARKSGVAISGSKVESFASGLKSGLKRDGFYPVNGNAPGTHSILDDLKAGGPFFSDGKNLSAGDYIALRQALQKQAQNFAAPKDQAAASIAIDRLDNLFDRTNVSNFTHGSPTDIADVRARIKDARGNFAAGYRSELLTNKQRRAELQTAATNSGMNLDNKLRQTTAGILTSPKSAQGFNAAETARMERIVNGVPGANAARFTGNLMGGGGGLGAVVSGAAGGIGAYGATQSPLAAAAGVAVPATGVGLKMVENALTKRAMTNLGSQVRLRSPLGMTAKPGPYSPNALALKLLLAAPDAWQQLGQ